MLSPQHCRRMDLRSGTRASESGRQESSWRLIEWYPPLSLSHASGMQPHDTTDQTSRRFVERREGWTSTETVLDLQSQVSTGEASTEAASEFVHSLACGCFSNSAAAVLSAPVKDESRAQTNAWLERQDRKQSIGEGDDALYECMRHTNHYHALSGGTSVASKTNSCCRSSLASSGHPHPYDRHCPADCAIRYLEVWHEWHDTTTGERYRDVSPRLVLSQPPPPRILHREVPELSLYSPLMQDGLPPWWEGMQL